MNKRQDEIIEFPECDLCKGKHDPALKGHAICLDQLGRTLTTGVPVDYRKILKEYIRTVLFSEGVTFICNSGISGITDEENRVLLAVEKEAIDGD
jgi:hypothetical protein